MIGILEHLEHLLRSTRKPLSKNSELVALKRRIQERDSWYLAEGER